MKTYINVLGACFFTSKYQKGANAERELIKALWGAGFSVVRTAGSGSTPLPAPDLVALSKEKKIAFECKAWDAAYLNLSIVQMEEGLEWARRAGAEFFVVWKVSRKGFLFLHPNEFSRTNKNYVISLKKAQSCGLEMNVVLGLQSKLNV